MTIIGFKQVLTEYLKEEKCEVSFAKIQGDETPSLLYVTKAGKQKWFTLESIICAWNNGLSVKSIAKRIISVDDVHEV